MKIIGHKIILILLSIAILIFGLYLTIGVLVYSLKEKDNNGFYGFFISIGLILFGIFLLVKGLRIKLKNNT